MEGLEDGNIPFGPFTNHMWVVCLFPNDKACPHAPNHKLLLHWVGVVLEDFHMI
ncbi:hypothetical protein CsSME_00004941 [Camellia sinensis var. sinensis]